MPKIVQQQHFDASPDRVYEALASTAGHAGFTGLPAEIGEAAGQPWSAFGGKIHGVQIELEAGRRIVQSWRSAGWDAGTWSLVTFDVEAHEGGTRLTLTHDAIPDGAAEMLEGGWHEMYWGPLRAWL